MGTRFLPATKAVPKELLPIIDTPALQLIIDEAVGAGIDHVVVVTSHAKPAIEAYFAPAPEVIAKLRDSGRDDVADRLSMIGRDVRISFAYQDEPLGLGHAVGCGRAAVGDEPFAVLLPDELMGDSSLLDQMARLCERYVLTPDVFDEIDNVVPGAVGEIQLTDALRAQAARSPFHGVLSGITRHDTGNPLGWLTAVIDLALDDPRLALGLRTWLTGRI
jgi:UTP--glucose-1-phosphate uridylyltransferase